MEPMTMCTSDSKHLFCKRDYLKCNSTLLRRCHLAQPGRTANQNTRTSVTMHFPKCKKIPMKTNFIVLTQNGATYTNISRSWNMPRFTWGNLNAFKQLQHENYECTLVKECYLTTTYLIFRSLKSGHAADFDWSWWRGRPCAWKVMCHM